MIKVNNLVGESDYLNMLVQQQLLANNSRNFLFVCLFELLHGADTEGYDTNPLMVTDYFLYIDDS
jgi:hypothetical protein